MTVEPLENLRSTPRTAMGHDRLTARQALQAALLAGDPNDGGTLAWVVAQRLMHSYAYANPDRAAVRAAGGQVLTAAKTCPVREVARLGRTLNVWRTEFS